MEFFNRPKSALETAGISSTYSCLGCIKSVFYNL
jgi:hypothetical protein